MRRFRWIAGLALIVLLLMRPQSAVDGAQQAMAQWVHAVAPSLFPFMALMPLLAGTEAAQAYRALLGGAMRTLFNLPGSAALAFIIGMIAGSPAGAAAARRLASTGAMTRGELRRVACSVCGMSPAFLIGGIGAGMLGDPAQGHILLRSQLAAQLLMALLLRGAWRHDRAPVPEPPGAGEEEPVRAATLTILTVCGYMTLFGAFAQVVREIAGRMAGDLLACALDVPTAARAIIDPDGALNRVLAFDPRARLVFLSVVAGFGGVCVGLQNLAALRGCGVTAGEYFSCRGMAAAFSGLITALQLRMPPPGVVKFSSKTFEITALSAAILVIPALVRAKNKYLNKQNGPKNGKQCRLMNAKSAIYGVTSDSMTTIF